jgi:glycerophosphoryl diester phosphodiesterase
MSSSARLLPRLVLAFACVAPLVALTVAIAPADAAGVNLHRGSRGPAVRLVESRLHRLNLLPRSAVDRRYRTATVRAVRRFQRQHHVPVTGRVNTRTWNLIAAEVERRANASLPPPPRIIGHRGAVRPDVPENTMTSLRYATGWADVLEFDVRLTADHELVLMHDVTLGRTTNCTGQVVAWTLADLRSQCLTRGEPIPTFEEAAAYAASVGASVAPELKNEEISDEDLTGFVQVLQANGLTEHSYVQSFDGSVLARIHAIAPRLETVLCSRTAPSVAAVRAAGATRVAVRLADLTRARVTLYEQEGLPVWTYTAVDRAGLASARRLGVTAVVTDIPRQARNYYYPPEA